MSPLSGFPACASAGATAIAWVLLAPLASFDRPDYRLAARQIDGAAATDWGAAETAIFLTVKAYIAISMAIAGH
jgi:hypothetical protein